MAIEQIRRDMDFLAGRLPHRGANTEEELAAASYLKQRFSELTSNTDMEEFLSGESQGVLFAAYYFEFLIVALLALWKPPVAFGYGVIVFFTYLAEFTGYRLMSRILPSYPAQNISAQIMGLRPRKQLVVTAHYDSGKANALSHPNVTPWLRLAHYGVILAMMSVLATCASQGMGVFADFSFPIDVAVRWLALAYLLFAAGFLFFAEMSGEFVRGAINNASGTAVLLRLAERFTEEPLEEADVWFVATGCKGSWLGGMRHFIKSHKLDKSSTYFLNIDHVGAGTLRFLEGEGMLKFFPASKEMLRAARKIAPAFGAAPLKFRGMPTESLIPLARGYKAMGITATGPNDELLHWNAPSDKIESVDFGVVEEAALFSETLLRELGRSDDR